MLVLLLPRGYHLLQRILHQRPRLLSLEDLWSRGDTKRHALPAVSPRKGVLKVVSSLDSWSNLTCQIPLRPDVCYGKHSGMREFRQNIIERWNWVMAPFQGFIQRLWVQADSQCAVRLFYCDETRHPVCWLLYFANGRIYVQVELPFKTTQFFFKYILVSGAALVLV